MYKTTHVAIIEHHFSRKVWLICQYTISINMHEFDEY